MKYIMIFIILLTSCTSPMDVSIDYENARRATIDAWEEVIGRVSDECYDRSVDAIIAEESKFPESCIPPDDFGNYIGCYLATEKFGIGGDIIYILPSRTELQKQDTAVHEFIHLLSNCEFGDNNITDTILLAECITYYIAEEDIPEICATIPGDYFHLDERLWDDYGPNTVEAIGCANLEL